MDNMTDSQKDWVILVLVIALILCIIIPRQQRFHKTKIANEARNEVELLCGIHDNDQMVDAWPKIDQCIKRGYK